MKNLDTIGWVSLVLVIVGGINLGLMGLIGVDLMSKLFGSLLSRLIFILIGAGAGYLIYLLVGKKKD